MVYRRDLVQTKVIGNSPTEDRQTDLCRIPRQFRYYSSALAVSHSLALQESAHYTSSANLGSRIIIAAFSLGMIIFIASCFLGKHATNLVTFIYLIFLSSACTAHEPGPISLLDTGHNRMKVNVTLTNSNRRSVYRLDTRHWNVVRRLQ